jgi:hypothetical protein
MSEEGERVTSHVLGKNVLTKSVGFGGEENVVVEVEEEEEEEEVKWE